MNRKRIVGAIMSVAVLFSATGCGNYTGEKHDESNTVIFGTQPMSGNFSPMYSTSAFDGYVKSLMYESLLTIDKNGKVIPQLAESVPKYTNNDKRLTFKLKKGLKFSDGSELNAYDVRLSWEALADKTYSGPSGYIMQKVVGFDDYYNQKSKHLSGIKILDKYTIQINFSKPDSDNLLDIGGVSIISDKQFKDYKNGKTKIFEKHGADTLGSGPYKLVKYDKADGAGLTRNYNYSGKGYKIKNVILKPVSASTQISDLVDGRVDILDPSIVASDIAEASKDSDISMDKYPRLGAGYVAFNTKNGATMDKEVRQSLMYAFDRQAFVDTYFECKKCKKGIGQDLGYVPVTLQNQGSLMKNVVTGKEKVPGLINYKFDVEKAKQKLDKAGWKVGPSGYREKNGKKLEIKMLAMQDNDVCNTLIPMWKKDWGDKLNIDFKVTIVDFNTLVSKTRSDKGIHEWNVIFMATTFGGTTMTNVYSMFHSSQAIQNGSNFTRVNDPKLDKIMEKAKLVMNEKDQVKYWKEAAIRINDDCAIMPVYGNMYYQMYRNDRLKNFDVNSLWNWTSALQDAEIKE